MKYNRAFILRNDHSIPILKDFDVYDESEYWLFKSGESFHGEHDEKWFFFKDSRIPTGLKLPITCVELEFTEEDLKDNP